MITCLAALAFGIFAIGMSHGSRPENYQVMLFVLACFTPFVLLILWIIGFLIVDAVWFVAMMLLFFYFSWVNPVLYLRYWADDNYQWAQVLIAQYYEGGRGGVKLSKPMARFWYKKAALNGSAEAQYKIARNERHISNAKKYFLMAAEQGHVGAMIHLVRITNSPDERKKWLDEALDHDHPEALFISAEESVKDNLPRAREKMVDAAEKGSRAAIIFLVSEYRTGGVLFDRDPSLADEWVTVLTNTPQAETDPQHLTPVWVEQQLERFQEKAFTAEEPESMFRQANSFLRHRAKDDILHNRALNYLKASAMAGYGNAAEQLAKIIMQESRADEFTPEALYWYEMAAEAGNLRALEQLTLYFKQKPGATSEDLSKSELFNLKLLQNIQEQKKVGSTYLKQQHWTGELQDTRKVMARLKRLGGGWEEASRLAAEDHNKEYLLAKELMASGQFQTGMVRMRSAAERGNREARFELANKTLNGPRSFSQEVKAITDLQELDREGFLPASFRLGMLYQSSTGVVPKNLYLAKELYLKSQADDELKEKADRRLQRGFESINKLQMLPDDNALQKIEAWYLGTIGGEYNITLLQQQYRALKHHFGAFTELRRLADEGDDRAQYDLAQGLQSHNLGVAMRWLRRSAKNGNNDARYELAVRMIRGKKNPSVTVQELKQFATSAAENGHVGAMAFIAAQYRSGNGGFVKDSNVAKKYYNRALAASNEEIIFEGEIAGRAIIIKRSNLVRAIEKL
jgi:TPR repeat protein